MQTFKIGAISGFLPMTIGEMREIKSTRPRKLRLEFMTNQHVDVWVGSGDNGTLIATGHGQFVTEFAVDHDVHLYIDCDDAEASVFMRGLPKAGLIEKRDVPSFTNIEPRSRRNSDLDRMMMLQKINEQKREEQFAHMSAQLDAALKAAQPKAEPKPEPKAEPKPEPKEPKKDEKPDTKD